MIQRDVLPAIGFANLVLHTLNPDAALALMFIDSIANHISISIL